MPRDLTVFRAAAGPLMTASPSGLSHQFHNRLARDETAWHISRLLSLFGEYAFRRLFSLSLLFAAASNYESSLFRKVSLRSGAEGIRTPDLLRAREALSQLSYGPALAFVRSLVSMGLSGLEPETFPLSEGCSNQLS